MVTEICVGDYVGDIIVQNYIQIGLGVSVLRMPFGGRETNI